MCTDIYNHVCVFLYTIWVIDEEIIPLTSYYHPSDSEQCFYMYIYTTITCLLKWISDQPDNFCFPLKFLLSRVYCTYRPTVLTSIQLHDYNKYKNQCRLVLKVYKCTNRQNFHIYSTFTVLGLLFKIMDSAFKVITNEISISVLQYFCLQKKCKLFSWIINSKLSEHP